MRLLLRSEAGVTLAFQRDFPIGRFRLGISTAKEPKLEDRGSNVWTLNFKRPVVSDAGKAEMGFAIAVAGFSKLR